MVSACQDKIVRKLWEFDLEKSLGVQQCFKILYWKSQETHSLWLYREELGTRGKIKRQINFREKIAM